MSSMIVKTKEELKAAQEAKVNDIIIQGELANKIKKAKKITKIGASGLGALTATLGFATVTAPVTGGVSYLVAAPAAALTGTEIAVIIVAASVGIALIVAIFKEYEEIEYRPGPPPSLKLRRKSF